MKNYLCLILTAAVFATAACGGNSATPGGSETAAPSSAAGGEVIAIDGSSTVYPVTEAVAEEFQKATPGTKVTVGRSGTGGGFQKFCRGESAISNASRPIMATEIEACAKAGITYIELPVAYDGMAIVVNPKNTWATSITTAELEDALGTRRAGEGPPMESGAIEAGRTRRSTCSAPALTREPSITSPR